MDISAQIKFPPKRCYITALTNYTTICTLPSMPLYTDCKFYGKNFLTIHTIAINNKDIGKIHPSQLRVLLLIYGRFLTNVSDQRNHLQVTHISRVTKKRC
jgi:hypothetical protein